MGAPIKTASAVLSWIVPLMAVGTVAYLLLYWGLGVYNIGDNAIELQAGPPRPGFGWIGLLADAPAAAAWLYALYRLERLLLRFRLGRAIDGAAARHLRAFAIFTIAAAFLNILTSGARRWAMGEHDRAFWTHIQVSVDHVWLIFTAMIFLMMSHILVEAESYKREAEDYL